MSRHGLAMFSCYCFEWKTLSIVIEYKIRDSQVLVAQKVTAGVYKGVTTTELDELAAETAASLTATHPDYALLAARIAVSNLHKNTRKSFSDQWGRLSVFWVDVLIHNLHSFAEGLACVFMEV